MPLPTHLQQYNDPASFYEYGTEAMDEFVNEMYCQRSKEKTRIQKEEVGERKLILVERE